MQTIQINSGPPWKYPSKGDNYYQCYRNNLNYFLCIYIIMCIWKFGLFKKYKWCFVLIVLKFALILNCQCQKILSRYICIYIDLTYSFDCCHTQVFHCSFNPFLITFWLFPICHSTYDAIINNLAHHAKVFSSIQSKKLEWI